MIKTFLKFIGNLQEKIPLVFLFVVTFISLIFLYFAFDLQTNSSFDVMYPEDSQTIILGKMVDSEFGSSDGFFILAQVDDFSNDLNKVYDLRDPRVLEAIHDLKTNLELEESIISVTSIVDIVLLINQKLPSTYEESVEVFRELEKNSDISGFVNSDYSAFNIIVSATVGKKSNSFEKMEDLINTKIDSTPSPLGVKYTLTGGQSVEKAILEIVISDTLTTITLAVIVVFLVLWFYFRRISLAVITSFPMLLTLVWLVGFMSQVGIELSVMVSSIGAMIIGMSIDYSIHITHSFNENYKRNKRTAIKETLLSTGSALFVSMFTTLGGFLAMLLGSSPNSQTQGLVLGVGVFFALLITILLLTPALSVFYYLKEWFNSKSSLRSSKSYLSYSLNKENKQEEEHNNSIISRLLGEFSKLQVLIPKSVLIAVAILTVVLIPGIFLVEMDVDISSWLPGDNPTMESFDLISSNFGSTSSQDFVFSLNTSASSQDEIADIRDYRILESLVVIEEYLLTLDWINDVSSPGGEIAELAQGTIPQSKYEIAEIITNNNLDSYFNHDYTKLMFSISADEITNDYFYEAIDVIESVSLVSDVEVMPVGGRVENIELIDLVASDTVFTTGVGFIFVISIASLFYRSLQIGLYAFIPVIFAIIWTVSLMGYLGIAFTMFTTGMLALLMGLGVDFSIHIIHKCRGLIEEKKWLPSKAICYCVKETGEALFMTTLTTFFGFLALIFASLKGTGYLGYTLAIGILMTFLACVIIVPCALMMRYSKLEEEGVSQR